jgi:hypothetical protein
MVGRVAWRQANSTGKLVTFAVVIHFTQLASFYVAHAIMVERFSKEGKENVEASGG